MGDRAVLTEHGMSNRQRGLVLAAAVLAGIVLLWWAYTAGWTDPDEIERLLTETGVWGPVVFVAIMWVFQPIGLPGVIFMVPAALVWPAPLAIALSWIGNMGASIIAFSFARWIGRDWAEQHIPPRMARWNDRFDNDRVWPVFLLRLFTGMLPPADWLLGVSKVRWRPFLIGTGLGIIPGILLNVLVGASLFSWLSQRGGNGRILAIILVVVVVRRVRIHRRARAARLVDSHDADDGEPGGQVIDDPR
jgi:uncharacterized membrane protein YdjX (TVP38/TMEM64 family)